MLMQTIIHVKKGVEAKQTRWLKKFNQKLQAHMLLDQTESHVSKLKKKKKKVVHTSQEITLG